MASRIKAVAVLDSTAKLLSAFDRVQEDLRILLAEDVGVLLPGEVGDGFAPELELMESGITTLIHDLPLSGLWKHADMTQQQST